jgi:biopolymer transport protein ExbD
VAKWPLARVLTGDVVLFVVNSSSAAARRTIEMKNFRRLLTVSIALAAFAVTQPGCMTPPSGPVGKSPAISLSRTGRVTVNGQDVQIAQLGKKLKAMGVPLKNPILVSFQKNTPNSMRTTIGRVLATAGYRKFMLIGPKETSVTTSTTTAPYQSTSTANKTTKASSNAGR